MKPSADLRMLLKAAIVISSIILCHARVTNEGDGTTRGLESSINILQRRNLMKQACNPGRPPTAPADAAGDLLHPSTPKYPSMPTAKVTVASKDSSKPADYKCTGVRDEEVINTAILKAAAMGAQVVLSEGVFNIEYHIMLVSNTFLSGSGKIKTVLRLTPNAPAWAVAGMIRGIEVSNVFISQMTIDGTKDQQPKGEIQMYGKFGFYCGVCTNVFMHSLVVKNHYGYGLDPHGKAGQPIYGVGYVAQHSTIENNGWDGIAVDKTRYGLVQNCTVRNNGRHGVNVVTGSEYIVVRNNNVYGNGWFHYERSPGCGIKAQNNQGFSTKKIAIVGNTITNSTLAGICLDDTPNTLIAYNKIYKNPVEDPVCMEIEYSNDVTLKDNYCFDCMRLKFAGKFRKESIKFVDQQKFGLGDDLEELDD